MNGLQSKHPSKKSDYMLTITIVAELSFGKQFEKFFSILTAVKVNKYSSSELPIVVAGGKTIHTFA